MRIFIKKAELEPAATHLQAWIQNIRLGLISSQIGVLKGIVTPLAQGVYYDKEALIDEHVVWDVTGEGEGEQRARKLKEFFVNGQKVGEEAVFKDPPAFQKAIQKLLAEDVVVDVPYLLEEKHIKESERLMPKDPKGLPTVDFGALLCLFKNTARIVPEGQ